MSRLLNQPKMSMGDFQSARQSFQRGSQFGSGVFLIWRGGLILGLDNVTGKTGNNGNQPVPEYRNLIKVGDINEGDAMARQGDAYGPLHFGRQDLIGTS